MEKTITIIGTGQESAMPDTIELGIGLVSRSADYSLTIEESEGRFERVIAAVIPLGFERAQIKTTHFAIDTEYDQPVANPGRAGQRISGFRCVHNLKVSFAMSMQLLAQIVTALTQCGAAPEITIHFTVKNIEALRYKALAKATAAAYQNASVLAKASRTMLGEILHIENQPGSGAANSSTVFGATAMTFSRAALNIQPDDVVVQESVRITWALR